MHTMRIYEFAKEHNMSAKDILALLQDGGFEVKSHMSVMTPEAISFAEGKIKPENQAPVAAAAAPEVKAPKKQEVAPAVQAQQESPSVSRPAPVKSVTPVPAARPAFVPKAPVTAPVEHEKIEVMLAPTMLADFAAKAHKPYTDIILTLLKWGVISNKNMLLSVEQVARLAEHYQMATVKPVELQKSESKREGLAEQSHWQERSPVVVVMGHVDHGKTTLLDFVRKTRVAAREKGGITQHLGAYEAQTPQGNIVFLDTPGHEAFSRIRARGTRVADIAILVVAADDGVMPQTVEAIKHARDMKVPVIVAINKIDKATQPQVDAVKRDLSQKYDLLPEEWGGTVMYLPISAKLGTGVDKLLEMVLLQSEVMELRADTQGVAQGYVLESKLEKGRGAVATLLLQHGQVRIGDYFVCGATMGKVSSMVDSHGVRVMQVGPSQPVLIAGFEGLPEAGDYLEVVSKEKYAHARQKGTEKIIVRQRTTIAPNSIPLIVKVDTDSSKEALVESIAKISKKLEKGFYVVQAGVGNISSSDIELAADTSARIYTLHVKPDANATNLAQRLDVTIESFDIIYKLLENLQALSEGMREIKKVRKKTGEAVVRKVFDIKGLGVIAGCYIRDGVFSRDGSVEVWRGRQKVGEGKISSLQRDKKTVKEVHSGFECGFMIEGFGDFQVDDRVDCFVERPESSR